MVKNDKQLVTKKDLKQSLDKFEKRFDAKIGTMEIRFENKLNKRIGDLEQKMFDWKSEIFNLVDGLGKVIRDNDEYKEITSHQITENTRRIEVLENNYTLARQ